MLLLLILLLPPPLLLLLLLQVPLSPLLPLLLPTPRIILCCTSLHSCQSCPSDPHSWTIADTHTHTHTHTLTHTLTHAVRSLTDLPSSCYFIKRNYRNRVDLCLQSHYSRWLQNSIRAPTSSASSRDPDLAGRQTARTLRGWNQPKYDLSPHLADTPVTTHTVHECESVETWSVTYNDTVCVCVWDAPR